MNLDGIGPRVSGMVESWLKLHYSMVVERMKGVPENADIRPQITAINMDEKLEYLKTLPDDVMIYDTQKIFSENESTDDGIADIPILEIE